MYLRLYPADMDLHKKKEECIENEKIRYATSRELSMNQNPDTLTLELTVRHDQIMYKIDILVISLEELHLEAMKHHGHGKVKFGPCKTVCGGGGFIFILASISLFLWIFFLKSKISFGFRNKKIDKKRLTTSRGTRGALC